MQTHEGMNCIKDDFPGKDLTLINIFSTNAREVRFSSGSGKSRVGYKITYILMFLPNLGQRI